MTGRRLACVLAWVVLSLWPDVAGAQPAATPWPRLEVGVSGGWWGGLALGALEPTLSGPQLPTGAPVPYFSAEAALDPGPAAEVRVGWRVWRHLHAEASGSVGLNRVTVSVRRDIEQAPAAESSARLTQFSVEGGMAWELPRVGFLAGRLVPFASAGGGYLRQLYEDRVLVETGRTAYAGGGLKWRARPVFGRTRWRDRLGLRTDVRLVLRKSEALLDDRWHGAVSVTGGVSLGF